MSALEGLLGAYAESDEEASPGGPARASPARRGEAGLTGGAREGLAEPGGAGGRRAPPPAKAGAPDGGSGRDGEAAASPRPGGASGESPARRPRSRSPPPRPLGPSPPRRSDPPLSASRSPSSPPSPSRGAAPPSNPRDPDRSPSPAPWRSGDPSPPAGTAAFEACLPASLRHLFPASPPPDPALQAKIAAWIDIAATKHRSLNEEIRKSRPYRNPLFFRKMVEHHGIESRGTGLSRSSWDPASLPREDDVRALVEAWTEEEKQRKARRERGERLTFVPASREAGSAAPVHPSTSQGSISRPLARQQPVSVAARSHASGQGDIAAAIATARARAAALAAARR